MPDSGAFLSLAEFAITLAGFTSVVVVFRRGGGEFHPVDRFRVLSALVASVGGAFLALLPVGLDLVGFPPVTTWRVSSLVHVGFLLPLFAATPIVIRRLPPESRALLHIPVRVLLFVLLFLSIIAGLLNATPILGAPQAGLHFFAVVLLLIAGAISFLRIVFIRPAA